MIVIDRPGIFRTLHAFLALPLALVLMAGCGGCKPEDPDVLQPEILSFSVDPTSIMPGEEATLSWETEHATSIEITDDEGEVVDLGDAEVIAGSVTVSPSATTRYTLTAIGEEGSEPVTEEITLTVIDPDAPIVVSFSADPDEILEGGSADLIWETQNGETIEISDGTAALPIGAVSADSGSFSVSPTETTIYTLTVTGPGGQATADATITVIVPATVVSFTATPNTPVLSGTEVTLAWETEGAVSVTLLGGGDVIFTSDIELDGSHEVTVEFMTEFTLVAAGMLGSEDTATVTVPVIPIIQTFEADADLVRPGDMVTFSWTTLGADRVHLSGPGGIDHEATGTDAVEGDYTVAITEAGTFTLIAESGMLDDVATVEIEITNAPRIVSLTAAPLEITEGGVTTIAWVTQGADSLALEITGHGSVDLGGRDLGSDQVGVTLELPGTAVATLTATNADGETDAQVEIEVLAAATIDAFSVLPVRVGTGESVALTWQTSGAASVRIEKNGTDIGVDSGLLTGSVSDTVSEDSSYVLIASNALGHEVASEALLVTIAAPEIVSFTSSATRIGAEGDLTFHWESIGGNQLEMSLGGDILCESTSEAEIASGSCDITAPAEVGNYTYELTVTNGAGSDVAQIEIYVSDGPIITDFVLSRTIITLGETFEITWTVMDDATGVTPELTLEDDLAAEFDISGFDPNQDTAQIEPDALGTRTYTFTASTEGTTPAIETFVVEVVAEPVVVSFTADPALLDTEGGTLSPESTLSWTVDGSVTVMVFELDESGEIIEPNIHGVDGLDAEQQQSGTLVVTPSDTTDYLLVAANAAGLEDTATLRIIVDPAEIVSFTAEAADGTIDTTVEILEGETVTLAWETVGADRVLLAGGEGDATVTEIFEPLIDISGTGTQLSFSSNDTGATSVVFPAGFTFPYYGVDRTEMRVMTDGFISFNMSASSTLSNTTLPNPSARNPIIAMLWDDLVVRQVYWEHQPAEGRLILHYHDAYRWNETSGSLNFQLILYGNGAFEFRYGTMSSPNVDNTNGARATIGFENDDGTEGFLATYNQEIPGGLENRAWRAVFEEEVALTGDTDVSPTSTTTYTLSAYSAQLDDTATVDVIVYPAVSQPAIVVTPDEIQLGDDFTIEWTVTNATRVEVWDHAGNLACDEVVETLDETSGTCEFIASMTAGTYTYTVIAFGTLGRDEQSLDVDVLVNPIFRLNDFSAVGHDTGENVFITSGESVTVTWSAEGADSASLFVDGIEADITAEDPNAGSYLLADITENTEMTFSIFDTTGRTRSAVLMIWVDAASVDSFAASETEIVAGESVTLSWETTNADEVNLVPSVDAMVFEIADSFEDISTTGTYLDQITGWGSTTRMQDVVFPAGFVFPYYGVDRTEMQVMIHGGLYFDMSTTGSYASNVFPNSNANAPRIALFWDDLDAKDTSTDRVYWEHRTLPDSRQQLIVQWNVQFWDTDRNPSTLQFQIAMYDDGVFEYRYGTMTANNYTIGVDQSAGFQNDDGSEGYTLFYRQEIPGGLSNRTWRIEFQELDPATGTAEVYPTETTTYVFCASGGGYDDCQEVEVIVHPAVTQPVVTASPAEVQVDENFELEWTVSNATRVRVYDHTGALVCDDLVETLASTSGSCEMTAPGVVGTYVYPVVATGSLDRDQQSVDFDLEVLPSFRIESFEADNEFLSSGDSVTVSWTTIGAASGSLRRGADVIPIAAEDLDSGSFIFVQFFSSSEIELTILDGTGRSRSQTITVYVNAASIDSYDASQTQIEAGESVTLSWSTTNADSVTIGEPGGEISIQEITSPLIDTSAGSVVNFTQYTTFGPDDDGYHTLSLPFAFNYDGQDFNQIVVTTDGFASFNPSATSTGTNTNMPTTFAARRPVIALYWNDLELGSGAVRYHHVTGANEHFVIHWSNVERYFGSAGESLNFQLVLYRSGMMEFRYGTMDGVDGTGTTIGFENIAGTEAHVFSYNQAVDGGIANRGWRISRASSVDPSGTLEVTPDTTTTYEICATGGGYTECQEVTIVVIEPGIVMASELMPFSTMGLPGQWIELYNTTAGTIDLFGWTLSVDGTDHLIASSLVVEPHGYVVLGRSGNTAENGGYVPDYVYGEDLELSATGSTIEVLHGTMLIDGFAYDDVDWLVTAGVSLSLVPDRLTGDPADNDDPMFWCEPTTTFGTEGQFGSPGAPNDELECG